MTYTLITPKTNQCGETCERAKMCATCAGVLTEFDEAVAAVDATLHHAINHWQARALKAEALLAQPAQQEPVALAQEVIGCFHAAEVEGLTAALANTTDEHLKDLVERRLMHALYAAQAADG